jgi:phosphate transport system protein
VAEEIRGELRRDYHEQIVVIEGKVRHLFALVIDGIPAATEALLTGDVAVATRLSAREIVIDELYRECENIVVDQLALQAPVASELRYFLAVWRLVPELERSHDLVEHIARRGARGMGAKLTPRARGLVERMGGLATEMWQLTGEAWTARDLVKVDAVARRDNEMDELHVALVAEMANGSSELPVAMDMVLVARFYERLGDHAVNLGERVRSLSVAPPAAEDLPALSGGIDG